MPDQDQKLKIIEIHQNPPNHPGCSFCKAPKQNRNFFFVNETTDCYVCDVCVKIMSDRLQQVVSLMNAPAGKGN